ncbi:MAG TPA: response regulator [Chromatiales bacterium]|nr:response regulator [Chromatiales bacterium]HEX22780.1 response regulator [Chromatiales bacterium]
MGAKMVLILEDDPVVASLYNNFLLMMAQQVEIYDSAEAALRAFRAAPSIYRHAILDVFLPDQGTDGLTVALQLREIKPHLPILFATGLDDSINEARLRKVGMYLRKTSLVPVIQAALTELIYGEPPDGYPDSLLE